MAYQKLSEKLLALLKLKKTDKKVVNATLLDNGQTQEVNDNKFVETPFEYGVSQQVRVVQFDLE